MTLREPYPRHIRCHPHLILALSLTQRGLLARRCPNAEQDVKLGSTSTYSVLDVVSRVR